MAIFAVLAEQPSTILGEKLESLYPGQVYTLTTTQWLVDADSIAQTVSERLGLADGPYGRVIVFPVSSSAAGWHKKTAWEWLAQKAKG